MESASLTLRLLYALLPRFSDIPLFYSPSCADYWWFLCPTASFLRVFLAFESKSGVRKGALGCKG